VRRDRVRATVDFPRPGSGCSAGPGSGSGGSAAGFCDGSGARSPTSAGASRSNLDRLRTGLCIEPRGPRSLLIPRLTEPVTPGARLGLVSVYPGRYCVSCSEGTIGAATAAVATGMVARGGAETPGLIDTEAGRAETVARVEGRSWPRGHAQAGGIVRRAGRPGRPDGGRRRGVARHHRRCRQRRRDRGGGGVAGPAASRRRPPPRGAVSQRVPRPLGLAAPARGGGRRRRPRPSSRQWRARRGCGRRRGATGRCDRGAAAGSTDRSRAHGRPPSAASRSRRCSSPPRASLSGQARPRGP
jgi:hypothetical protein